MPKISKGKKKRIPIRQDGKIISRYVDETEYSRILQFKKKRRLPYISTAYQTLMKEQKLQKPQREDLDQREEAEQLTKVTKMDGTQVLFTAEPTGKPKISPCTFVSFSLLRWDKKLGHWFMYCLKDDKWRPVNACWLCYKNWLRDESEKQNTVNMLNEEIAKIEEILTTGKLSTSILMVACKQTGLYMASDTVLTKCASCSEREACEDYRTKEKLLPKVVDNVPITKEQQQEMTLRLTDLKREKCRLLDLKICAYCKREFKPLHKSDSYCTDECKQKQYQERLEETEDRKRAHQAEYLDWAQKNLWGLPPWYDKMSGSYVPSYL